MDVCNWTQDPQGIISYFALASQKILTAYSDQSNLYSKMTQVMNQETRKERLMKVGRSRKSRASVPLSNPWFGGLIYGMCNQILHTTYSAFRETVLFVDDPI